MVHVTWPRPFQGWFAIRGLALATLNLCTEFEVSTSSHYEDMEGDTTYRKWGGLGVVRGHSRSLDIAPFDRAHTSSYYCSIVTMSLSCTVSQILRDVDQKLPIWTYPISICRPRKGSRRWRFAPRFWPQTTSVPGLLYGVIYVIVRLAVLSCDGRTEGQMDGRTDSRRQHVIYRASIASRGKSVRIIIVVWPSFAGGGSSRPRWSRDDLNSTELWIIWLLYFWSGIFSNVLVQPIDVYCKNLNGTNEIILGPLVNGCIADCTVH